MTFKQLAVTALLSACLATSAMAGEGLIKGTQLNHNNPTQVHKIVKAVNAGKQISGTTLNAQVQKVRPANIKNQNMRAEVNQQVHQVPMFETIKDGNYKKAVIFVGGVNDTFHFLDRYIDEYKDKDVRIIGYEGPGGKGSSPYNVEYLDMNANYIAAGLAKLSEQGVKDIDIISFSLGGVVTKDALLKADSRNHLSKFNHVNFTAVSSPLGGFAAATSSTYLPFARPITKLLGYAMSTDMGPNSDVYQEVSKPFPKNVSSTLIETKDDPVAQPTSDSAKLRYSAVASQFKSVITLVGDGTHTWAEYPGRLQIQGVDLTDLSNVYPKYAKHMADRPVELTQMPNGDEILPHPKEELMRTNYEPATEESFFGTSW